MNSQHSHTHNHGVVDPSLLTTQKGIWAVKWSFIALIVTAIFQLIVVYYTGSVALLADTIHNFADAVTAIPLWIAFLLTHRKPSKKFTYGYGRVEDLAGVFIVLMVFGSAVVAGYQSIERFFNPQPLHHVTAVLIASLVGFVGNEAVAIFRIKIGRKINSAALVADGYHARMDGVTSLFVFFGALGVYWGYPIADAILGFLISLVVFGIVWQAAKSIFLRLLDGVEEDVIEELQHAFEHVGYVINPSQIRARWVGHFLHAQVDLCVQELSSLSEAEKLEENLREKIRSHIPYLKELDLHLKQA